MTWRRTHWTCIPDGWCERKDKQADEYRVDDTIKVTGEASYPQNVTCLRCLAHPSIRTYVSIRNQKTHRETPWAASTAGYVIQRMVMDVRTDEIKAIDEFQMNLGSPTFCRFWVKTGFARAMRLTDEEIDQAAKFWDSIKERP